jgi:DNA-binding protein HU-beta
MWCIVGASIQGDGLMHKTQVVEILAERASMTKADAQKMLDSFQDIVSETLGKGDDVVLTGFGTFSVGKRSERTGRNPRTGEPLVIAAANVPKFSPGAKLKAAVNGGVEEPAETVE